MGDIEAILWILLGAVGIVLLFASANVTNLSLVRSEARHGEVAIRAALGENRAGWPVRFSREPGAWRGRWVRGAAPGAGSGAAAGPPGPTGAAAAGEISIDASVLLFGFVVSVAAGVFFGLLPALRASAVAASRTKDGG